MKQNKKRKKKISLKDITKQYNDVSTPSIHVINEEEGIYIQYYKAFDNKRIEAIMKEAYSNLEFDKEHNLNFFNDDEIFIQYVFFLILKYMTNLRDEIPSTLDKQINIFNQLISIGLFEEMFNNVFDPNEVSKVLERIGTFAQLASQITELEERTRSESKQTVQHPLMQEKVGKEDA